MTNIAIIIESLSNGGAERVAGLLSFYLSQKHNVFVFVKNDVPTAYKYGGELVVLGEDNVYSSLKAAKDKYSIDCAISFSEPMNCANVRTKGNELVIVSHRNTTEIKDSNIPMIQKYYPYADAIVACSEGCRSLLIKNAGLTPDRVFTITNFLNDWESEKSSSGEDDLDKYGEYILSVGRLTWEKDHKYLIKQFVAFRKKNNSKLNLLIIGSGGLENELRELIKTEDAENYIFILPYTSDIGRLYKKASAFVLTSVTEGYPNVLLDAFIFGLPVISTDCVSGPREIINDETDYSSRTRSVTIGKRGVLIPTSDPDDSNDFLVRALEILLSDKKLICNLRDKMNEFIRDYSNERISAGWEQAISNAKINPQPLKLLENDYFDEIKKAEVVIIYGAGKCGHIAAKNRELSGKKMFFAITDGEERKESSIPVFKIDELTKYKDEAVVLLASYREQYCAEMSEATKRLGFSKVYFARL